MRRDAGIRAVRREMPPLGAGTAVVWIDSNRARILRWRGRVVAEEISSDVPAHVHGTQHVRHDPLIRHGGSGAGQDEAERRREEHMRRFIARVAGRLSDAHFVDIVGTGRIGQRLAKVLRGRARGSKANVVALFEHSNPLTSRQLVARLRVRLER